MGHGSDIETAGRQRGKGQEMTPEEKRAERAQWMFEFLVGKGAWNGCRDWEGLDRSVRDAFTDMAALMEHPGMA